MIQNSSTVGKSCEKTLYVATWNAKLEKHKTPLLQFTLPHIEREEESRQQYQVTGAFTLCANNDSNTSTVLITDVSFLLLFL